MIITRTPLRVSFVGGGSDLPAFYREEPGCVVSAAIDKYVYLSVNAHYGGGVRISYSRTENVADARAVDHPLVRAALDRAGIRRGIEIVSVADVPAGTGLGSSSSFTVGLLAALSAYNGEFITTDALAAQACRIEIHDCRAPIGKQDQYAAAFGGLRCYTFHPDERVSIEALAPPAEVMQAFERRLLLLAIGEPRAANGVLARQAASLCDSRERASVRAMANLAGAFRDALLAGRLDELGSILDGAWRLKRARAGVTNGAIDDAYTRARALGAQGGKLCGAGGSGFLLLYAPEDRHEAIVKALGLRPLPIRIAPQGSAVVYADAT